MGGKIVIRKRNRDTKIVVITDILNEPLDEGAKNVTYYILKQLKRRHVCVIFSVNAAEAFDFVDHRFFLNKMLISLDFYKKVRDCSGGTILYMPEASITPASFMRGKLLQIFTGKKVTIMSLQPRKYNIFTRKIIRMVRPHCVITQSTTTGEYLNDIGINNRLLPLGVDKTRFNEVDKDVKKILRRKYDIENDKIVLLHVGHIRLSRNLEWLVDIKLRLPEMEVIMVGSTYGPEDKKLYERLIENGIIVIQEYLSRIEEIFNISDFYIFPVVRDDGAIETPLSVLEAMACNLPIITSRFGSLPDVFEEDECFHFITSSDDAVEILRNEPPRKCNNRTKVKPYTWNIIVAKLEKILG